MLEAPRRRDQKQPGTAEKALDQVLGVDLALPALGCGTLGTSLSMAEEAGGEVISGPPGIHFFCTALELRPVRRKGQICQGLGKRRGRIPSVSWWPSGCRDGADFSPRPFLTAQLERWSTAQPWAFVQHFKAGS